MSRRSTFTPTVPTAAAVVSVLAALEARPLGDPGRIAFGSALARLGREAREAGGSPTLAGLVRAVKAADPTRAANRAVILCDAWGCTRGSRGGVAVRQRREREARAAA